MPIDMFNNSISVFLLLTCLSAITVTGHSLTQLPDNCATETAQVESRNSRRYPTIGIIYTQVQCRRIAPVKVWRPNAMQSGDLIWGAQIAILGYALVLIAFVLEGLVIRWTATAQFA